MLGAYDCREETSENLVLTRAGLPDTADNLARSVYKVLQAKHLTLPGLTDECPEWDWYLESWSGYLSVPGVLNPWDDPPRQPGEGLLPGPMTICLYPFGAHGGRFRQRQIQ